MSLFDAMCFDFAPLADSDDQAGALNSAQDARVQVENLHSGCTLVFPCQSSIGAWQNLERCAVFPRKPQQQNVMQR